MNDGAVIWRSKEWESIEATVTRLRPISLWLVLLAVVVIAAVSVPLTVWLYGIAGDDPARRMEAIKIGSTVAAGLGGFFALWLAFRRQHFTEMIAVETREARDREYEQRDRAAEASERDAEQRRITELYTKAADQLGSEKAPVRLAGLHALERLAQNTPDQRQTIVDVICAYLRMPYTPPDFIHPPDENAPSDAHTRYEQQHQELQVRHTAQRILTTHLRPGAAATFRVDIDLNLSNSYLDTFDLTKCQVRTVQFDGAHFAGWQVGFKKAQFDGNASFHLTTFDALVNFSDAKFGGFVEFRETQFCWDVGFDRAQFTEAVSFMQAKF